MEQIPLLHTNNSLDIWLDSEIKYNEIDDNPEIYKSQYNNVSVYYNLNDSELKMKNSFLATIFKNYKDDNSYLDLNNENDIEIYDRIKYMQYYTRDDKSKLIYINPNTNRYIVDMLFRKLLDNCSLHSLICPNETQLITKNMRRSFYKFCYENSMNKNI